MDVPASLKQLAAWRAAGLIPADVHASAVKQIFETSTPAWAVTHESKAAEEPAEPKALVALKTCFSCWSKGDIAGFLANQAEGVMVNNSGPKESKAHGIFLGKKGVAAWIQALSENVDYLDMHASQWVGNDTQASFLFTSHFRSKEFGNIVKSQKTRISITANAAGLITRWDNSELDFEKVANSMKKQIIVRNTMKLKAGTRPAFQKVADKLFGKLIGLDNFIGSGQSWSSDEECVAWGCYAAGTDMEAATKLEAPLWGEVMQYLDGAPGREVFTGLMWDTMTSYGGKCACSSTIMKIKEGEKANMYKWVLDHGTESSNELGFTSMFFVEHDDTTFEVAVFYPSLELAQKNAALAKKYFGDMASMLAAAPERKVSADAWAMNGHDALCFYLEQTFNSAADANKAVEFNRKMNGDNLDDQVSMSFLDGTTVRNFYAFEPQYWCQWNMNMARYMQEMMGAMSLATKNKAYFMGKATSTVRAMLEQWKQAPNFEIIEPELLVGLCSFRTGLRAREGIGYINIMEIHDGMDEKYAELAQKFPAAGFTGKQLLCSFKVADGHYVQIGANTLEGWKAEQKAMQSGPQAAMLGEWIPMLKKVENHTFGAMDDEAKAMMGGWDAMPWCTVNYHAEGFEPCRVNY